MLPPIPHLRRRLSAMSAPDRYSGRLLARGLAALLASVGSGREPAGGEVLMSGVDEKRDAGLRLLGAVEGVPAVGSGPVPDGQYSRHEYDHPAAGWGAARSVGRVIEGAPEPVRALHALLVMNQE